jgi:hypothetical protein
MVFAGSALACAMAALTDPHIARAEIDNRGQRGTPDPSCSTCSDSAIKVRDQAIRCTQIYPYSHFPLRVRLRAGARLGDLKQHHG